MSDESAKKTILLRRARFLAAALASVGCGKTTGPPVTEVDVVPAPDAEPMPCLSPVAMPIDAGVEDPPPAPTAAEDPDAAIPRPCLSRRYVPPPRPAKK